jgi:hypothetical protein
MGGMTTEHYAALRHRILSAVGLCALATPAAALSCGGKAVIDPDTGSGTESTGAGADGAGASGASSSGGSGGLGGSGFGGSGQGGSGQGGQISVGGAGVGGATQTTVTCFFLVGDTCPPLLEAPGVYGWCTSELETIVAWQAGPVPGPGDCCYEVEINQEFCGKVGRPLRIDDAPRCADPRPGDETWAGVDVGAGFHGLTERARAALADAWLRDAFFEHASVAAFSHAALELLAVGAPPELLRDTHQAAMDEVHHAELCFALARRFGGEPTGVGAFADAKRIEVRGDLVHVAVLTFLEGCVGETLGAAIAREQHERATDSGVRGALDVIARDEARHAELAWRTVAWALEVGGSEVRAALVAALADADRYAPTLRAALDTSVERFGRLTAESAAAVRTRALREVVWPCAAALFGVEAAA